MSNQDSHTYPCHWEQRDHRCQQQLDQKQNKQLEQSLRKYSFFKDSDRTVALSVELAIPAQHASTNHKHFPVTGFSVFCSLTQITAVPPFRTSKLCRVHNSPRRTFTSHMLSLPSPKLSPSVQLFQAEMRFW